MAPLTDMALQPANRSTDQTMEKDMGTEQRFVRLLLVCVKALLIVLALLLLIAYFGSHVREAGGTVAGIL